MRFDRNSTERARLSFEFKYKINPLSLIKKIFFFSTSFESIVSLCSAMEVSPNSNLDYQNISVTLKVAWQLWLRIFFIGSLVVKQTLFLWLKKKYLKLVSVFYVTANKKFFHLHEWIRSWRKGIPFMTLESIFLLKILSTLNEKNMWWLVIIDIILFIALENLLDSWLRRIPVSRFLNKTAMKKFLVQSQR